MGNLLVSYFCFGRYLKDEDHAQNPGRVQELKKDIVLQTREKRTNYAEKMLEVLTIERRDAFKALVQTWVILFTT